LHGSFDQHAASRGRNGQRCLDLGVPISQPGLIIRELEESDPRTKNQLKDKEQENQGDQWIAD
jgi:hypothetical protein